jgi:hypothetical protein
MRPYQELLDESEVWLADHATSKSGQAQHGPCGTCRQNMQLLNGVPIRHHEPHAAGGRLCAGGR